jgi:hemolysin activation/secretion protein
MKTALIQRVAALGLAPAVLLGVAHAQSTREEILRLPAPLRATASDFGAEACAPGAVAAALEGETPLGTFSGLDVAGATAIGADVLSVEWRRLVGERVSREGLARIAARVECRYREAGFVFARASVTGDPEDGRYTLRLREGKISRVEVAAADDALAGALLRAFRGVEAGAPLNAADVRQGLANAASIGIIDVRPTVRRSRADPETIDLILVAGGAVHQLFVQAQNANDEPLGPWGAVAGVRLVGLTPLYERTTFGIYFSEDGESQQAAQASVEALLSSGGLKAQIDAAYALARPGDRLAPLDIEGETTFFSGELSHPIEVRRGFIAGWRVGLEAIDQRTEFFGGTLLNDDSLRVARAGVRADGLWRGAVWNADVDLRRGVKGLGASEVGDASLSRPDADPEALVVRAETSAALEIGRGAMRLAARGQHADSSLLAFEEFNFGALSGGRAFVPGAIAGDRGVAINLEASSPAFAYKRVAVQPFAFVDAARAWNEGVAPVRRQDGASAGAGVRVDFFERARLEVLYAEPIETRGLAPGAAGAKLLMQFAAALDFTFAHGFKRRPQ